MAQIKKLSKEQLQMIVAIVLFTGAFGYLYWRYLYSPYANKIAEAELKIEAVDKEISKATGESKKLDQIKAEVERLQREELLANQQLPKGRKLPDLIYTLMRLSRDNSVSIANFAPISKTDKQYFSETVYSLNVSGSYHSVGRFITALGVSQRIFSVRNMIFAPAGATGQTLSVTFQLVAYQYKE